MRSTRLFFAYSASSSRLPSRRCGSRSVSRSVERSSKKPATRMPRKGVVAMRRASWRPCGPAPATTATRWMPSAAITRGSTSGTASWAAKSATGVTATHDINTRSSKEPRVRVAHPSMRRRATTRIHPESVSRAMAPGLVPRGARPGKVSENTSSARMMYGPSKGTWCQATQAARAPTATRASSSMRTRAAGARGPWPRRGWESVAITPASWRPNAYARCAWPWFHGTISAFLQREPS